MFPLSPSLLLLFITDKECLNYTVLYRVQFIFLTFTHQKDEIGKS